MNKLPEKLRAAFACAALAACLLWIGETAPARAADLVPLKLIVMDPLAAPLSCPCVEGYAQRDYQALAEHLQRSLGREVKLVFGESLKAALKKTGGKADVIIGKHSVVRADAKAAHVSVTPIGHLTDKSGSTKQHGLIVVNRNDPAKEVKDLAGYSIIFGPAEAVEKHSAALTLLTRAGVEVPPERLRIDAACSDGACKVIDLGPASKTAAVISSYAQPLLEGCGTIKKGDLRVVGKTAEVVFVTAFVADQPTASNRRKIEDALQAIAAQTELLDALESLVGFLPASQEEPARSELDDAETPPTAETATSKKKTVGA